MWCKKQFINSFSPLTTLSDDQAGQFLTERKAKVIWEELSRVHTGKTEDRRIDIAVELKNIRMANNESIKEYITRAKNIASRSASIGYPFEEIELVYHVVRGINEKYENVATVLRAQRSLKLDEAQQTLEEEECKQAQVANMVENAGSSQWKNEKVFKAKVHHKKKDTYQNKGCYICGKTTHIARNCYHRANNNNNEAKIKKKFDNASHRSNKCHKEQSNMTKEEDEYCLSATRKRYVNQETRNEQDSIQEWALDSGSTSHMTPNDKIMHDMRSYDTSIGLAEEERTIETEAIGHVKIAAQTNQGKRNLFIKNVLYAPALRNSLLSVSQLIKAAVSFLFWSESIEAPLVNRRTLMKLLRSVKRSCTEVTSPGTLCRRIFYA